MTDLKNYRAPDPFDIGPEMLWIALILTGFVAWLADRFGWLA